MTPTDLEQYVDDLLELLPPSYDDDVAGEAIIERFVREWAPVAAALDEARSRFDYNRARITFRYNEDTGSLELHRAVRDAVRGFLPSHLGIVYLLAEQQGATHTRLRRLWDAKSARSGPLAWPWISDSGIRTRCSELVRWGIVEDSGAHGESATGRPSTIWTLVGAHPQALGRDVEAVPSLAPEVQPRLDVLLAEAGDDVIVRSQLELAMTVARDGVKASPVAHDDASAVDQ